MIHKGHILALLLVLSYAATVIPLTTHLKQRPIEEKIGYVPHAEVLRLLSADQKELLSALLMMKVISYYGAFAEKADSEVSQVVDHEGMSNVIEVAVRLDPYNVDAYYFAQAIFAWDPKQVRFVNELHQFGMKYRTWDFYLPYFVGFNSAYFLKDYAQAAEYYRRVGELTGDVLSMSLAGRYLYEAGQTDLAISYLSMMVKSSQNDAIRKTLSVRLMAFKEVRAIEHAIDRFSRDKKRQPSNIHELIVAHYLDHDPRDPYGGIFYIDEHQHVRSTSKFAYSVAHK